MIWHKKKLRVIPHVNNVHIRRQGVRNDFNVFIGVSGPLSRSIVAPELVMGSLVNFKKTFEPRAKRPVVIIIRPPRLGGGGKPCLKK